MAKRKQGLVSLVSDNENLQRHLVSLKETAVAEIRKLKLKILHLKNKKLTLGHDDCVDYKSNSGFQVYVCHHNLVCQMFQNSINVVRHIYMERRKNELRSGNFLDVMRIFSLQKYMEYNIRKYAKVKRYSRFKKPKKAAATITTAPTKNCIREETQKILMNHIMSIRSVQHIVNVFVSKI